MVKAFLILLGLALIFFIFFSQGNENFWHGRRWGPRRWWGGRPIVIVNNPSND